MRSLKDQRVLLAHTRQAVDGKEAAVRDHAVAPVHECVGLALVDVQHIVVKRSKAPWHNGEVGVEVLQHHLAIGRGTFGKRLGGQVDQLKLVLIALLGQNRHAHLAAGAVVLMPINVEVALKLRIPAVLQHIPEPPVHPRVFHTQVVRHDVQDQAKAALVGDAS